MALPDYQMLMLPLLTFASDGEVHTTGEAIDFVSSHFHLSDDESHELLAGGGRVVDNRTHWALTYLRQAKLLASAGHGKFEVTPRGLELLQAHPTSLSKAFLASQYPELSQFISRSNHAVQEPTGVQPFPPVTPPTTTWKSSRHQQQGLPGGSTASAPLIRKATSVPAHLKLRTYSYRFAEQVLNSKLSTKQELESIVRSPGIPVDPGRN